MKCEGKKVESEVVANSLSPEWASAEAIFYRRKPEKPIKVQASTRFSRALFTQQGNNAEPLIGV